MSFGHPEQNVDHTDCRAQLVAAQEREWRLREAIGKAVACVQQDISLFPRRLDEMTPTERAITDIACELTGRMQYIEQMLSALAAPAQPEATV